MQRRKALQRQDDINKVVAEIRERDRERIVFFRQIGEIGDRYAWKGIHNGEIRRKLQEQQKPNVKRFIRPVVTRPVMVPFPDAWMNSVVRVRLFVSS